MTTTNTIRPIATRTINVAWLKSVGAYNGVARYSAADLDVYAGKVHTFLQSVTPELLEWHRANLTVTASTVDEHYAAAIFVAKKGVKVELYTPSTSWRQSVDCPFCAAKPGVLCTTKSGVTVKYIHNVRWELCVGRIGPL